MSLASLFGGASPVKNRGVWQVVASHHAAQALTGTTAETAIATVTVPGKLLGKNGILRITTNWGHTNNANAKSLRIRVGTVAGTQLLSASAASALRTYAMIALHNRNNVAAQIGNTNTGSTTGYGQNTSTPLTTTIDTDADFNIVFSGQLGVGTDTITLEGYFIEALYMP